MSEKKLYTHIPHPPVPAKVTIGRRQGKALTGFNMKIAVAVAKGLGTMICAYIFAILAIIGFPGFGATIRSTCNGYRKRLSNLSHFRVLTVLGQRVLSKHGELMAEEQYNTTISTYHDIEQIMQHLSAQDAELFDVMPRC